MSGKADIQWIIDALGQYQDAKLEHDQALADYNGDSWGYAGENYINNVDKAAAELARRLDDYIDSRIEEKVNQLARK